MAQVRPFRALRPPAALAARVAALPYDVMSTAEARDMAAGNKDCYLHVTRPEIDLPPGTDEHADAVYAQGARALADLRARGSLAQDPTPGLFFYRLTMGGRAQTGLVGLYSVADYDAGRIVKHEHTRPDKVLDRTRHIVAPRAHYEPVFLIHRASAELDRLAAATTAGAPLCDFTGADGVRHALWRALDAAAVTRALGELAALYIADGHHRAEASSRAWRERGGKPDDPAAWFLAVAFPADQARILPYNRLVHDLHGRTPDALLAALAGVGQVDPAPEPGATPSGPGDVRLFLAGRWHRLRGLVPTTNDPVARLDVQTLQDRVLGPLLGIDDPRTSSRITFVGGIRGTAPLEAACREGRAAIAFSLAPVTPDQLLSVADAGRTMPPKSTWFEPKLRSGLFVHAFDA